MAINFASTGDGLTRSGTYFNQNSSWTRTGWMNSTVSYGSLGDYKTIWLWGDNTYVTSEMDLFQTHSGNVLFEVFDGVTTILTAPVLVPLNGWFQWALVYDSVAHTIKFYFDNILIDTLSIDLSTITFSVKDEYLCTDDNAAISNLSAAYNGVWQTAYSLAQIQAQWTSAPVVNATNLLAYTPLNSFTDLADTSGNGRDWSNVGSAGTTVTGPLAQYGGCVGLTSDFQRVPSSTILGPIPIIAVGSSPYPTFDLELNISSTSITSGPSTIGYKLVAKYRSGGIINTTAKFNQVNVGYIDAPVGDSENFFPSSQQVIELVFKYGTYNAADGTRASDGGFEIFRNNSSIFALWNIPLAASPAASGWGFVELGPAGWATSYYISQAITRVAGYGTQSFSTPGSIHVTVSTSIMDAPFTYPNPVDFAFPVDANILEANNFSAVNPITFFSSAGGRWNSGHGTAGVNALVDLLGINAINGTQNWPIADQMLNAPAAGYIFNNTSAPSTAFTPHTIEPPVEVSPSDNGNIRVIKVVVPSDSTDSFDFTTANLTPSTFSLLGGEQQLFSDLTPGDGYEVTETLDANYTTTYEVSNDSPHDNLVVDPGATTTVTVTNTHVATGSIYKIVPNKRNDTIFDVGDVKIPDPLFKTGLIGG